AARGGLAGEPLDLLGRHQDEPGVLWVVAVGRVERGPPGTERAVEPELDRAHGQAPVVAHGSGAAPLAVLAPRLLAAERREETEREAAALDQARVRRHRAQVETGFVCSGQLVGEALGDGLLHR